MTNLYPRPFELCCVAGHSVANGWTVHRMRLSPCDAHLQIPFVGAAMRVCCQTVSQAKCSRHHIGPYMVRLFIGGLAADTTPALLAPRFTPFGDVLACDVVPGKPHGSSDGTPAPCRGFGYVSLEPTDDAALRRCLSAV